MNTFKKILLAFVAIVVVSVVAMTTIVLAYNENSNLDLSKSYDYLYRGGNRAEYDIGSQAPYDDVCAQASKSVAPHTTTLYYLEVNCTALSGVTETAKTTGNGSEGNSWISTGWTKEIPSQDFAQEILYNFDGYTIRHY